MEITTFVEKEWREQCEKQVKNAANRCGLSDYLFTELLSESIDRALASVPSSHRLVAMEIARECGYEGPEEREMSRQHNAEWGYCNHGLDPDCCPCGCGDLDCYNEHEND